MAASGCGPRDIYNALLKEGFSTAQAVGIMANMIAESRLNPEARARDTNGYYSNGLVQFNESSYPGSRQLVTGNCKADIAAQVHWIKAYANGAALKGSSGSEVAGNFAANFERCQGCQAGSTYPNGWSTRVANATTVQGWVSSGKWPTSAAGVTGAPSGGGSAGAGGGATDTCLLSIGGGHVGILFGLGPSLPSSCLVSKTAARGAVGALLLIPAGILGVTGLVILAAFGIKATGAAEKTGSALEKTGAAVALVPGAQAAGAAVNRGGAAVRRAGRGQVAQRPSPGRAKAPAKVPATAGPETPAAKAPARSSPRREGSRADKRGTSPEFRRQYLGEK